MDRRDMRRSDWRRILKKRYVSRPFQADGLSGVESLIGIEAITEPLTVHSALGAVKIVEVGYCWLQIAPRDRFFWLTAMFDEKGDLLQLYFDITAGNHFDEPDNPEFEDMYLDIVMLPDGQLQILDEDELDAALNAGEVGRAEYDAARAHCRELYEYLRRNAARVVAHCRRAQRELAREIRIQQ